ncbi:MAG: thymidylate synthase [Cyanobacteria bacterium P01_D01_bin.56]
MSSSPLLIEEINLSHAWAKIILHVIDNPGKEISPLIVSITGFSEGIPIENENIKELLNIALEKNSEQRIGTVANTIFPESLWRRSRYERKELFERYTDRFLPRAKAIEPHKNRRGLYFERLISFGSGPHNGNQLEHIISEYLARSAVRRTMFQASIFDPGRDHTRAAQLPFPCLQHVSFVPHQGTLTLNAFYATQQIFNKAYGNYLGLCRLGRFMSCEMNLSLSRVNCFVGVAKLDKISKSSTNLAPVIAECRRALESKIS